MSYHLRFVETRQVKSDRTPSEATAILEQIEADARLRKYIDPTLSIPKPFRGAGEIKLVVLGQDPTIKNAHRRSALKTVLNLDRNGSVRSYLAGVCHGLGIDIKTNVYATNVYKNFFVMPPTQIEEIDIFAAFAPLWLPFLQKELNEFVGLPILTLGEPVLRPLVHNDEDACLREYWGYTSEWKQRGPRSFRSIAPAANRLCAPIFPFPHQPSLRKWFYKSTMSCYTSFMRATAFAGHIQVEPSHRIGKGACK